MDVVKVFERIKKSKVVVMTKTMSLVPAEQKVRHWIKVDAPPLHCGVGSLMAVKLLGEVTNWMLHTVRA